MATQRSSRADQIGQPAVPVAGYFSAPDALRAAVRCGDFAGHTVGQAPGYLQANLAIVPADAAFDFLRYCQQNPKPCPVIGVTAPGDVSLPLLGRDIDLRSDVPGYRVFENGGAPVHVTHLKDHWREDLVGFALGCSFSFEDALVNANIPVRHLDAGRNVPMYRTSLDTRSAGRFGGPLVVTARALPPADAIRAIQLSARFPLAHGAPVHIGDAAAIGIKDLLQPDFGDPPVIEVGDICVFWACGVTPQLALQDAGLDFAATHEPGYMLVTDVLAADADRHLADVDQPLLETEHKVRHE